jgi:methylenetetrahydrofolate dehydrogenase (NADP+)/methenyltetrahydrofolate cyclohydrolase
MQILDGKETARQIRQELEAETAALKAQGVEPALTVILVGDDPASQIYVRNKERGCRQVGIKSNTIRLPKETTEAELLGLIERLNNDPLVHGILVQLPLPGGIAQQKVIDAISPAKDVDGFHPISLGRLLIGQDGFRSCTPYGIMELLHRYGIPISGREAVVVGRSNNVGKPMAALLLAENATVTVCHSQTRELAEVTRRADILVVAVGKAKLVTRQMVKPGAVVIDVGMNRTESGLSGDVDFAEVKEVAAAITPVPGGVGPMTVTMLLANTVRAAGRAHCG